jgi:pilus assembly protein CpaF
MARQHAFNARTAEICDALVTRERERAEAFDMLQALNTGHAGTLSTIHANSAAQALARLASCVLQAGMDLPYQAIRVQEADAINFVLHLDRVHGRRTVTELIRVRRYVPDHDQYDIESLMPVLT